MTERRLVKSIKVGKRHRKDLGDIEGLAHSISQVNLLQPVVVTPNGTLIAGGRRLAAVKKLGWKRVPVHVVDLDAIMRGEFAENAVRKDFAPSEIDAIRRDLEPIEKAAAKARMSEGGKGGKVSRPCEGGAGKERARDKIGAFAGVSGRTVEKIARVVEAAKADPDRFAHLVEEMDRTGKVEPAFRKLRQAEDEERVKGIAVAPGKYRTLVIDPPWEFKGSIARRAAPEYATMTHNELLALDIARWAEEDCHLYLWTTNNLMPRACELLRHWGFEHKTVITWLKPKIGLGSYFRNSTEHALFGVRGQGALNTRTNYTPTHFEGPIGTHSEKPEAFYEIVRANSHGPFGEGFQRKQRKDFEPLMRVA